MQFCTGHGLQMDLARASFSWPSSGSIARRTSAERTYPRHCPVRKIHVRALVHEIEHERDDLLSVSRHRRNTSKAMFSPATILGDSSAASTVYGAVGRN